MGCVSSIGSAIESRAAMVALPHRDGKRIRVKPRRSFRSCSRSTIEKPMSTTRGSTGRPSARSTMKRAACRPMRRAVDAHRGQRRMQVGGELEVAEADDRQLLRHRDAARLRLGHARRAPAGRSCRRRRRRRRRAASSSAERRRGRCAAWSAPARRRPAHRVEAERARRVLSKASWRRLARSSLPATTASRRRPLAWRNSRHRAARRRRGRSRPACRSASASDPRSRPPGCRRPSRRLRPSAECMMPVRTMPSGRRPMIAPSSASSRLPA